MSSQETPNPTEEQILRARHATMEHIARVRDLLNVAVKMLLDRGDEHDLCKLESPEIEYFAAYNDRLHGSTYGSPEFNATKSLMKPALDHHYANSNHHPEHYPDGVGDMTLIDLLEMFIDWKASSERHLNGNILMSIEVNAHRFDMGSMLRRIFENTAREFDQS